MRPKSNFGLFLCVIVALASGALLIARIVGWINLHWITVVISGLGAAFSAFMVIKEFIRKPFLKEFHHSDWIVIDPEIRKGVCIRIPKTQHGAGNKPSFSFVDKGVSYGKDFEVVDEDGDLTIYHPENSFMPVYKSFVIRIV